MCSAFLVVSYPCLLRSDSKAEHSLSSSIDLSNLLDLADVYLHRSVQSSVLEEIVRLEVFHPLQGPIGQLDQRTSGEEEERIGSGACGW